MDIFDLSAKLSLNTDDFDKNLSGAEKSTSNFGRKLKTGFATAAKVGAVAVTTVGTAAAGTTKAIIDGTKELAAYGDAIDKGSKKIGISATSYQEWDAILQHSGSSIDSMTGAVRTMNGVMGKANTVIDDTAKAEAELERQLNDGEISFEEYNAQYNALYENAYDSIGALSKLGFSMEDITAMSNDTDLALEEIISALQKMPEGAEKTALAQELLGRSAMELGPLLSTSAEETEEMRKRVHELGGVMSDEAVKAAAAYQDSLQDMQTSLDGAKRGLVSDFMPAITTVMDGLSDVFAGKDSGIAKINEGIKQFVSNLSKLVPKIIPMVTGIAKSIGSAILDNADVIIKSGVDVIVELSGAIVKALPKLVKATTQIIRELSNSLRTNIKPLLEAATQSIVEIVAIIADPQFIGDVLQAGIDLLLALVNGMTSALPTVVPMLIGTIGTLIVSIVSQLGDALPEVLQAAFALLMALVQAVPMIIEELIPLIPTIVTTIVDILMQNFPVLLDGAIQLFFALIEAIPTICTELLKSLPQIVETFLSGLLEPVLNLFGDLWQGIVDLFSGAGGWFYDHVIAPITEFFSNMWSAISELASAAWDAIVKVWTIVSEWFNSNIIQPVREFFSGMWDSIKNFASNAWNGIKSVWSAVTGWFRSTIIDPIKNVFKNAWDFLKNGAKSAWEGIKSVFTAIPNWFKDKFHAAWQKVKDVFSAGGRIFTGIKEGIVNAFKAVVNAIITGINKVVAIPFNGINWALGKIRDISILGIEPFSWIKLLDVPQIPLLARGGVVNSPTVAMIGESGREAIVPLENNTEWTRKVAAEMADELSRSNDSILRDIQETLHAILANMGVDIVLNDGVIAGRVDRILGQTAMRKIRGNA